MDKLTAQSAVKELYGEAFSLTPSAIISLFEIDIGLIGFSLGVISQSEISSETGTVFRFHNNIKLNNSSLFWRGKEYIAAPIMAEDFEVRLRGTLPTPKLTITVSADGIPALSRLKEKLLQLGDLVGAKVTRIKTFAKFIDATNFYNQIPPDGFSPNPNAAFPSDVFYIDSKSNEDKFSIQYMLGSSLDVQGQKLPGRLVNSSSCPHQYRGQGCLYEYNARRIPEEHGEIGESTLPVYAPSVANETDERVSNLLPDITLVDRGAYDVNISYNSGDSVYITHNNLNYYFVANGINITTQPPNARYWIADQCSKKIRGCEYRFALGGSAQGNITLGNIPFGGFPAVTRFS